MPPNSLTTRARVYPAEWVTALSTTLQTPVLKSCSLSPHLILNIVLAHPASSTFISFL